MNESKVNESKQHIPFLDHLRGIAILGVFLAHALKAAYSDSAPHWGIWFRELSAAPKSYLALYPLSFGWAGVAIFFVISGFCIHLSFVKGSAHGWRDFYLRRFFRIYPPYLLALLVFAFVFPATRLQFGDHLLRDTVQLGSHLLLIHNLHGSTFYGINGSFWSIAVEWQLYLIYPILLAFVNRLGWRRSLILIGTVELLMRGYGGWWFLETGRELPVWLLNLPFFYWYSWAIGAALADAYIHKHPLPFRSTPAVGWLLLAIVACEVKPLLMFAFPLFALCTATAIAKLLERDKPVQLSHPAWEHLRVLGIWSYALYLLHEPVLQATPLLLQRIGILSPHPLQLILLYVCAYPVFVGLSYLYHRYCELPSIAFGKRFLRKANSLAA